MLESQVFVHIGAFFRRALVLTRTHCTKRGSSCTLRSGKLRHKFPASASAARTWSEPMSVFCQGGAEVGRWADAWHGPFAHEERVPQLCAALRRRRRPHSICVRQGSSRTSQKKIRTHSIVRAVIFSFSPFSFVPFSFFPLCLSPSLPLESVGSLPVTQLQDQSQHRREILSRPGPAERQNQKTLRFFTVWHPRHHPHFLMFCTRGTFRTDLDKKNLLKTPCLPSVFFPFF